MAAGAFEDETNGESVMAIDPALEQALRIAVEEAGQPKSVASRLIAWLEALSLGGSGEDGDRRFYQNARDALQVKDEADAD